MLHDQMAQLEAIWGSTATLLQAPPSPYPIFPTYSVRVLSCQVSFRLAGPWSILRCSIWHCLCCASEDRRMLSTLSAVPYMQCLPQGYSVSTTIFSAVQMPQVRTAESQSKAHSGA